MNLGQGYNWQVAEWPLLLVSYDQQSAFVSNLVPNEFFSFVKDGADFVPAWESMRERLELNSGTGRYEFTDTRNARTEFDATGRFVRQLSPAGEIIEVLSYAGNRLNPLQVQRSATQGASTTVERLSYEYETPFGGYQLTQVTLQRQTNGGSWENVVRASYGYYGNNENFGSHEDLKTITTESWDGTSWNETGTTLYRYYSEYPNGSSSSSSSSSGEISEDDRAHLLKYVVLPAAYARMLTAGFNPLTVSDGIVALFADHYFEYNTDQRVTKELVQGGSLTFQFSYSESDFEDDYNAWKMKTTETLPDGTLNIVYSNYASRTMLHVYQDGIDQWSSFTKYDASGRAILEAAPSAVTGYDEAFSDLLHFDSGSETYEFLRDEAGLISVKSYHEASGYLASESLQQGQLGTLIPQRAFEYVQCCCSSGSSSSSSSSGCGCGIWFTSREIVYPSTENLFLTEVTEFERTFYPGTCAKKEVITTLPMVSEDQNGDGVAATRRDYFDIYGNRTWSMDERGFITRMSYDIPTGAITQQVQDVDTGLYEDVPAGWSTPSGGGLNLVTDFEHDDRGRITQALGPSHQIDLGGTATTIRHASWTVFAESSSDRQTRVAQGYATGSSPSYTYTLINPVSITKTDISGKVQEQIQAMRASTSGKLLPSDEFDQSSYSRWQTTQYTDCCIVASTRVYHTIPASGEGDPDANYDETGYGYDVRKRQNRAVTPGGTITRTVFEVRDLPIKVFVGTDDTGATASDPTGGGAMGNNMVLVSQNEYDGAVAGGDGNLTSVTLPV
ncbi:MAG: hypothetical protein Q8K78_09965, partial [Planctomycetaceae bacterium]|nr:hypothetical protein [Planctomycetaceae bacterium]